MKKTWNQLTKDQRKKAAPLLYKMLTNLSLKSTGDRVGLKKLSNQLAYMKRKKLDMDKIGPESLDSIKVFTIEGEIHLTFDPVHSWNQDLIAIMCFFSDTQPRSEDAIA